MMKQKGFGIIEVVISLAVISFLFLSLLAAADLIRSYNKVEQVKMYSSRIKLSLSHLASLKATVRASTMQTHIPSNKEFADQIYKQSSALHHNGDGTFSGVSLFLPILEVSGTEILSGGQITGTPDYPLRYNAFGYTCDLAHETCLAKDWPIEVVTDYNFSCAPAFHESYDYVLRGGSAFAGPLIPNGYRPHSTCRYKSQLNLRLIIRESRDASAENVGKYFKEFVQVRQIPLTMWPTPMNP